MAAVGLGRSVSDCQRALDRLIDVGLLSVHQGVMHGEFRFRFHDLLRDFARQRISEAEVRNALSQISNRYGEIASAAIDMTEKDRPGIAMRRARNLDQAEAAILFANGVDSWYFQERDSIYALALQSHELNLPDSVIVLANCIPTLYIIRGEWNVWENLYRLAIINASKIDDNEARAYSAQSLANVVRTRGDFDESDELIRSSLQFFTATKDTTGRAYLLIDYGLSHMFKSKNDVARSSFEESIRLFGETGNAVWVAHAQRCLGILLRKMELPGAVQNLQSAIDVFSRFGDQRWRAFTLADLAGAYRAARQLHDAETYYQATWQALQQLGEIRWAAVCNLDYADLLVELGRISDATVQLNASRNILNDLADEYWLTQLSVVESGIDAYRGNRDSADSTLRRAEEFFMRAGDKSAVADVANRRARLGL